jgi:hypothetical protein
MPSNISNNTTPNSSYHKSVKPFLSINFFGAVGFFSLVNCFRAAPGSAALRPHSLPRSLTRSWQRARLPLRIPQPFNEQSFIISF